jgi:spore maturation protein CgeB
MPISLDIVIIGLSITSSWGNSHATTYRALVKGLAARGHRVRFLERDKPWYATNRDIPAGSGPCRVDVYGGLDELTERFGAAVRHADLTMIGSSVPECTGVAAWVRDTALGVTAFYDMDTPVTLARMARGDPDTLPAGLMSGFDLYLSFTGGPTLRRLERDFGVRRARVLYASVDPDAYFPEPGPARWDLGCLGAFSADRQPVLDRLLLEPARRWPEGAFAVAGTHYPADISWPANVMHTEHLPPAGHRGFYNAQRFTLNVPRADMVAAGWSPGVCLFDAAACGTPLITNAWPGLDSLFRPGHEILVATGPEQVLRWLRDTSPARARMLGRAARRRVLQPHTGAARAAELESYVREVRGQSRSARAV